MSIMDMFRPAPVAAPAPVATPAQPGNLPEAPTSVDPAQPNAAPATTPLTPDSPLAQYATLWDTPTSPAEGPAPIVSALDPAKLQEIMAKANFSNTVSPEHLAAISQGGEGAQVAFTEAMNAVARQVMTHSTMASNKMLEQAVEKLQAAQAASLPELMRKHTTTNTLTAANPLYSNAAIRPVLEAVQSQLAVKNPTASAAELATMAQNFVKVMSESLNPTVVSTPNSLEAQDWDKFMN